ncbi:hypothetical protein [Pedobacter caeni]|uniref:Uncharacterized protein n=1 Tax=Pedobacter caeni TaxID=288992 RepID=A0A1M5DTJ0_9SPHI|nr:hypothetical protein [Pedobacter caeni]SHF70307.1 hypothetical protein SAMN04488522_103381 [Pedobacter caeni]
MQENNDFKAFKEAKSWFFKPDASVVFKETSNLRLSDEFKETFPVLTSIVQKARTTSLEIDEVEYLLFAWNNKDNLVCGWLNKVEKSENISNELIPEHELMLCNIGGIQESFNQPEVWLGNNQDFMFIGSACFKGIGGWDEYYSMLCEEGGFEQIDYSGFLTFVEEANGGMTMYDINTKKVVIFSHDHCFTNVDFMEKQPEYTFHTIHAVETFTDYVEEVAVQWKAQLTGRDLVK